MNLSRFQIPTLIRFDAGINQLPRAVITTPLAEAHVYLHGAHVTHFQPRGQAPVLFLSRKAWFESGKPIRGGVPVIFPWFGPNRSDKSAPQHGLVRTKAWEVESTAKRDNDGVEIILATQCADCRVRHRIHVGSKLSLALEITNLASRPFAFEESFHPYFTVGDARQISVEGLEGCDYLDQTEGFKKKNDGGSPVRVTAETDRVYVGARGACVIHDPAMGRRVVVAKKNSADTVVWNPWTEWGKSKSDFDPAEWQRMICVEPANVRDNAVTLAPGATHVMEMEIHTEPLNR